MNDSNFGKELGMMTMAMALELRLADAAEGLARCISVSRSMAKSTEHADKLEEGLRKLFNEMVAEMVAKMMPEIWSQLAVRRAQASSANNRKED